MKHLYHNKIFKTNKKKKIGKKSDRIEKIGGVVIVTHLGSYPEFRKLTDTLQNVPVLIFE